MKNKISLSEHLDSLENKFQFIIESQSEEENLFTNEDENENEDLDLSDIEDIEGSEVEDPTVTPEKDDIPSNENGVFVSDTKLAMIAKLLVQALIGNPVDIPQELQNVTSQNANDVIAFAEKALTLEKPQNKLGNNITKV